MSDWQIALDYLEEKINEDLLETCLENINSCSGGDENELKAWVSKLDHLFYYYKVDGTRFVSHIALLARGYLRIVINAFIEKKESEELSLTWLDLRQEIVANFWPIDEKQLKYH